MHEHARIHVDATHVCHVGNYYIHRKLLFICTICAYHAHARTYTQKHTRDVSLAALVCVGVYEYT
jgi:hypothetical protein